MATDDTTFISEIRAFTGIEASRISSEEMDAVLSDAKRHVKLRASLNDAEVDWYGDPAQEEALNWATKLFLKVAAGELESQTVQVGAIDHKSLLAKSDNSVTLWYRNMENAIRRITKPGAAFGVSSVARTDREYGSDTEDDSGGGISL
ncbi:hypothetical protein HCTV-8_gp14 [Haloarcula virus HCTV-8]|jgi:hypothetical protein|uniref:Uncharacterized protein n=4 Tax=Haloferacalesvirus hv5 TaxID=1273753 RepID=A0AAE8XVM1_9CAUD|nr:hypothetical protein HCTV-7_gp14 [Haloarcula phage HCTV-7]UBF20455.1 hypothetical protein HCTV-9_gp14 [Haloarcula phage HCTV-9]UBF20571.1 hypothetical protein HCTV-11_gp14 [Haloarcula phage HCTV-11]UBF20687.1 hypothetical protein HRTV-9_gp14 [Halorubrum virus HRTV-9]UBF20800.1 hypothetical protein HRTV-16_gp14 [Halorubrum virus HRTV-16]UBF20913.1 hypothetical protein HCTV-8_gp14 [Haloarcula virus HCTV-8]UBF21025.1 hypothetical protein HCTV-10_gp14 [Haloarcula virus HCTV-10]UBF21137.1 hypo